MKWCVCSNVSCGKWGYLPPNFHELKTILKCGMCGSIMYPSFNPAEAGYKEKDRIANIKVVPMSKKDKDFLKG